MSSTEHLAATQVGDPIIRASLTPVEIKDLKSPKVAKCIEALRRVNNHMEGVGISANQVGYNMRISLIHVRRTKNRPDTKEGNERIMINPEIISLPPASSYMWEGCLSVAHAGLFVPVMRHKRVKVKYLDSDGREVIEMLDGLEAHIAQHEIDHLGGVIFLDKDIDRAHIMSTDEYVAMRKKEREAKK